MKLLVWLAVRTSTVSAKLAHKSEAGMHSLSLLQHRRCLKRLLVDFTQDGSLTLRKWVGCPFQRSAVPLI